MCTISYLPTGPGAFLLASNRDEHRARKEAQPPVEHQTRTGRALWPIDGEAGGTWIALTDFGIAYTLMNDYQGNWQSDGETVSRGTIIPEIIDCTSEDEVTRRLERLHDLRFRPFRLLMASASGVSLWHFDGSGLNKSDQGQGAGLWVSAGGEESRIYKARSKVFEQFLRETYSDELSRVKALHTWQESGPGAFSFQLERDDVQVQTVSATIAEYRAGGKAGMHYMNGLPSRQKKWQTRTL